MRYRYTTEEFTADIAVDDYIAGYRDEHKFNALCKQCPNYGASWSCPPFEFDTEKVLRQYKSVRLIAAKIIPFDKDIAIEKAGELIRPERQRLEAKLLEMERRYGGRAFTYVGSCIHCQGAECRRKSGKPCLHPDKVRPSLEAFGFDIGRTLSQLFGIEILWGRDGVLPEYLTLVCALLHNSETVSGD